MKTSKMLATIALSAMLLTGCSLKGNDVIIKVNDQNITQAQFDKTFEEATNNSMFKQMKINVKDKNNFLYMMIQDRVVSELIVKELLNQEMEKKNIKVSKDEVNEEIKNVIDRIGSKEKFDELLKQNGISTSQFKKNMEEEVKMQKLVKSISGEAKVSDAEVKTFYKENLAKFKYPEKVRASHILIAADPKEVAEIVKSDPANKALAKAELQKKIDAEMQTRLDKANKILAEVKKDPKTFAKVAKENSEDTTSAEKGGDLGFFAKPDMVPAFSKVAFEMKPNTISKVVKTQYGYHIIMVTDRTAAGQESLDKVKPEIKDYLKNQKQVKVLENLIDSLKKNAKIEYVNEEYNPKTVQEALKEQAKASATQAPKADKKAAKKTTK